MASAFGIKVPLGDVKDLLTALDRVKRSYRNKYLRSGIRKATRLVQRAAKNRLKADAKDRKGTKDERTRLLEQSMTTKVTVNEATGKVYGIVGPDVKTQGERDGKPYVPANIAHLVEFGHAGPAPAPPHPFLRPAFDETKDAAMSIIRDELEKGLVEAARKGL